ncbi:MAG: hypothetical protein WAU01_04745 [Saprospiraceae bacterium]
MNVVDFFRFLFKMTISGNQMVRDMNAMRKEISELKNLLIPFDSHEMELLSMHQSNKSWSKGYQKINKGIFNTIYFEPLVAYGIKDYRNKQKLILITTSKDEFIYITKGDITHVYMNTIEAGVITLDGKLYNLKRKLLGVIDGSDALETHTVWIQGKEMGYISNPKFASNTIPRAYSLLKPMALDEQNIFLCLTLINLVEEAQL